MKIVKYTGKQNRDLRAKGHHLKPVLFIGNDITRSVVEKLNEELRLRSLLKVRLSKSIANRKETAQLLAKETGAHVAQIVGRIVLLYLPKSDES